MPVKHVSNIVQQGGSLYVLLTRQMQAQLGWKRGDYIATGCSQGVFYCTKIPLERILSRPHIKSNLKTAHKALAALDEDTRGSPGVQNGRTDT